jgi:hypothetical protein
MLSDQIWKAASPDFSTIDLIARAAATPRFFVPARPDLRPAHLLCGAQGMSESQILDATGC